MQRFYHVVFLHKITITAVIISIRLTITCAVFAVSEICCVARACVGAYGVVTVGIDVTVM